ncbi:MAG TPA: hypothetical protein VFD65_03550, partial [Chitinophagales bacterium]|nr:hypothetical protein [Chitinophagales bacterium]
MQQKSETRTARKRISKESIQSFLRLMQYMRPYRGLFSLGIAALLLSTFSFLFFPFILSMMADVAQGKPFVIDQFGLNITFDHRNQLALLLLAILSLQAIFSFSRVYIFA